ncbi:AAA family ATPase [Haladaptatus sp. GCM10025707]|uniref:AAA family ATPase n=1 Tax=unclassified Haladaptatus TaxID=2622732 RepID=UPI0023E86466|nr:AAA family ATPase [Haladaptatus sp. QDMS2]
MDGPLWTDTHAPALSDLPQPEVRDYLTRAVDEPINLVLHGPQGSGKTAAVRALAREAHDDPDNDLVEINVADFFNRTKKEITNDPRFEHFLTGKSDLPKRDMINHVLKESASYAPVSGTYKTILLDNAEAIREDFQQALRRVMERHHKTTQFVVTTRQPTKLIPPIKSRCFPVPVRAPTAKESAEVLRRIVEAEEVEYEEDGIQYLAGYGGGDLRKAILGAQTTFEDAGEITMQTAYEALGEIGNKEQVETMVAKAEKREFTDARKILDDLLVDEGYSGSEILQDILGVARSRYSGDNLARLYEIAGEIDMDLAEGTSDRIHISHLLAEIGR